MLTSVRASCSVPQNPLFQSATILVEYRATEISKEKRHGRQPRN